MFRESDDADQTIKAIEAQVGKSSNRAWYAGQLDAMGPQASPLQQQRFDLAVAYLEHHHVRPGSSGALEVDQVAVLEHMQGIDFHSDVRLNKIEAGQTVEQYNFDRMGSYSTNRGYPSQQLGISDGHQPAERKHATYQARQDIVALESRCRDVVDTHSDSRMVRHAPAHAPSGQSIHNADRLSAAQPVTHRADLSRSSYQRVTDSAGNSKLEHRSGEYTHGGGKQLHIPKQVHPRLEQVDRRQTIPSPALEQSNRQVSLFKPSTSVSAPKRTTSR